MSRADPVAGRRILVTRPAERAAGLADAIAAAGGRPILFPTIEIVPRAPSPDALAAARSADVILFTSPAAVRHGAEPLDLGPDGAASLGAVGPGTAGALRALGFRSLIEPRGSSDSEGLLRTAALAPARVADRRVLIVRGEGGRDALARGLMARDAAVDYAEVYRRERPRGLDPAMAAGAEVVTATSNEGLANLLAMLDRGARSALLARPLAVASARAAALARARGFARPAAVAEGPADPQMMDAIRRAAADLPPAAPAPETGGPGAGSPDSDNPGDKPGAAEPV